MKKRGTPVCENSKPGMVFTIPGLVLIGVNGWIIF